MRFKLLEKVNTLVEDIEAVRKQYPDMSDEDFNKIIRIDPTFDQNRDSVGTYGKWLLNQFKKGNITTENDFEVKAKDNDGDFRIIELWDLLEKFDDLKKDKTKKLKSNDINSYSNPSDVYTACLSAEEVELSDRQKLRQKQTSKDYDYYDIDDTWAVFVPHSWEADVALGKGTSWCTADSREESGKKYYDEYLRQGGQYYILMNKNDKDEKYQFHFESNQFMDASDQPVDLSEFTQYPKLVEFFEKEGYNLEDYSIDISREVEEIYGFETYARTSEKFTTVMSAWSELYGNVYAEEDFYDLGTMIDIANGEYDDVEDIKGFVEGNMSTSGLGNDVEYILKERGLKLNLTPDRDFDEHLGIDWDDFTYIIIDAMSSVILNEGVIDTNFINEEVLTDFNYLYWDTYEFAIKIPVDRISGEMKNIQADLGNNYNLSDVEYYINDTLQNSSENANDVIALYSEIQQEYNEFMRLPSYVTGSMRIVKINIEQNYSDELLSAIKERYESEYGIDEEHPLFVEA